MEYPKLIVGLFLLTVLLLALPCAQADITTGLVAWWPFDAGAVGSGSSVVDVSGNANHATMGIDPNVATFITPCKIGGCFSFDGTGDHLYHNSVTLGATTFTIAAWIRPTGAPADDGSQSYDLPAALADNNGFIGIHRGTIGGANDSLWFYNWDGDEDRLAVSYTVNTWVHVVMVHEGGTLFAYKDGVLATSGASGTTTGGGGFVVGRNSSGTGPWAGDIDEVRVYSRALNAAEVAELFAFGQTVTRPRRPILMQAPLDPGFRQDGPGQAAPLRFVAWLQGRGRVW